MLGGDRIKTKLCVILFLCVMLLRSWVGRG